MRLCNTDLHGFVASLKVEGGHLRAHVPHSHRVVVGGIDALRPGIHPAQLRPVVPAAKQLVLYGVVQLDFTPEIEMLYMLFERC